MGNEFDEFLRMMQEENKFILKLLEILEKMAENKGKDEDMKQASDIKEIKDSFKEHLVNGGHCSGFVVNAKDKEAIDEVCRKAEKMNGNDNFSFDHIFIKNMTDDNYTVVFKSSDYEKVNEMCKFMKDNQYEISFDYEEINIRKGFEKDFKDIEISEIEVDIEREDLINTMKEELSKHNINYVLSEKEDTKGFTIATKDEKKLKSLISMLPIDMDDKKAIYDSYKRINDRTEAKEATKEKISSKTKKKSEEKTRE